MKQFIVIILLLLGGGYFIVNESGSALFNETVEDHDDDDDDETGLSSKKQLVEGSLSVSLSDDTQRLAGFKTLVVESLTVQKEVQTIANVININSLIKLKLQYENAAAKRNVIRTQLNSVSAALEQLEKLNAKTTNVSLKQLQEAHAEKQQLLVSLSAEDTFLSNLKIEMKQEWGNDLAEIAMNFDSEIFQRLLNRQEFLVLLTINPADKVTDSMAIVFVNLLNDRFTARKAYLISVAPYSHSTLNGETFFLRTDADGLREGMQLYAWIPSNQRSSTGVFVPDNAVIWTDGLPWVYVQTDANTFQRRSLANAQEINEGWLINNVVEVGEKIVTSGAQTLLSEEFKWAIPDEDDD